MSNARKKKCTLVAVLIHLHTYVSNNPFNHDTTVYRRFRYCLRFEIKIQACNYFIVTSTTRSTSKSRSDHSGRNMSFGRLSEDEITATGSLLVVLSVFVKRATGVRVLISTK